jgi:hypothetical protein
MKDSTVLLNQIEQLSAERDDLQDVLRAILSHAEGGLRNGKDLAILWATVNTISHQAQAGLTNSPRLTRVIDRQK